MADPKSAHNMRYAYPMDRPMRYTHATRTPQHSHYPPRESGYPPVSWLGPISPVQRHHSPFRMRATEFFDLSRFQSCYVQRLRCLHPVPLPESFPSLLSRSLRFSFLFSLFFFFLFQNGSWKRIENSSFFFCLFVIVRIYIFDVTGTSLFVGRIGHGSRMAEDRTQPIRHAARANATRVCAFVYSVARFPRREEGGVGSGEDRGSVENGRDRYFECGIVREANVKWNGASGVTVCVKNK